MRYLLSNIFSHFVISFFFLQAYYFTVLFNKFGSNLSIFFNFNLCKINGIIGFDAKK